MSFGQDPLVVVVAGGGTVSLPFDAALVGVVAAKADGAAQATAALAVGVTKNGSAVTAAATSIAVGDVKSPVVKAPVAVAPGANIIAPVVNDGADLATFVAGDLVGATGAGANVTLFLIKR